MVAGHAAHGGIVREREVLIMRRALMTRGRRWLYISHRWIGIVTCLLFAMWFVSGIVMMYVAFPQLTDRERWAALPMITWDRVQVTPDRAMAIAGLSRYPRDLRLVDAQRYAGLSFVGLERRAQDRIGNGRSSD